MNCLNERVQMRGHNIWFRWEIRKITIKYSLLSSRATYIAQSVGHLTLKSEVLGLIPGLATYFCFSFHWFKRGSCLLLAKVCTRSAGYNPLGSLSLPRKSVARLTEHPDMTLDVYSGHKTTTQQQQQPSYLELDLKKLFQT